MIANSTTLILGAGASQPLGYPTGAELRQKIIDGIGIEPYLDAQRRIAAQDFGNSSIKIETYNRFKNRFRRSHVLSIDAFLAESENAQYSEVGTVAIAAALLTCEYPQRDPDWYADLFNAIRFRADDERRFPLKIVTFNYDVSLEFVLFHAFMNTYDLSVEKTRVMFRENVEIIHVYGDLGKLTELSESNDGRIYGENLAIAKPIIDASLRIHIIGRDKVTQEAFAKAFEAISSATFVAILGYGFDRLNNSNLRLQQAVAAKHPFATGFGMGCGARARLTSLAHQSSMVMGGKRETVREFLHETDLLRWINEPGATAASVSKGMKKVFENSILPYAR
ncbi:MAG: hypothetical protein P4L99_27000 [Chthoniobacter sp.]|nr:hypothetical protein [Chthoniobacter sp.]